MNLSNFVYRANIVSFIWKGYDSLREFLEKRPIENCSINDFKTSGFYGTVKNEDELFMPLPKKVCFLDEDRRFIFTYCEDEQINRFEYYSRFLKNNENLVMWSTIEFLLLQ